MRGLRILMYHALGEPGEPAARFVVPIRAFERQMAWLARLRFNVVRLDAAVHALLAGDPPPPRAVALTFDDGRRDNRTLALPVEPLVSLEPHTRTHPSLPTLGDDDLEAELRGSREDLEARTGRSHVLFAYPYGHFDERVAAAVPAAGFVAACSVRWGPSDPSTAPYALKRYEIGGRDSLARFLRTLCLSPNAPPDRGVEIGDLDHHT